MKAILLSLALLVVGCGQPNPRDSLTKYLEASLQAKHEAAYRYISASDKKIKILEEYLSEISS